MSEEAVERPLDVMPLSPLTPAEHARLWRLRFRLRERLARSLVVLPSLYILFAVVLAELVPRLEGTHDIFAFRLDPDTARTILSAVAGGMIAFTGLVVSLAVVVVQFGASQYTPRLISRFRRDPVFKHALGIFIAPAIYALRTLRFIGRGHSTLVPGVTVTLALLLLIGAVIVFFVLVGHLLDLLRPRLVIARVVEEAIGAIEDVYPAASHEPPPRAAASEPPVERVVPHTGSAAVLIALDRGQLVRAAASADVVVEVAVSIGDYVPSGTDLFRIRGDSSRVEDRALRCSAVLGSERTIAQDPAFAIRAIVDIALRALSPAVNDPTTAVQALDGLESLLRALASRQLERGRIADAHGQLRLISPTPGWAELLDLAVGEIRHYGADSPQVARRLRSLLLSLSTSTAPVRHSALADQIAQLDVAVCAANPDPVTA